MFSKIEGLDWLKRMSITNKLTCGYVLTTSLILFIIVIAGYWAMEKVILNAEKQFIYDEVQIIDNFMKESPNNSMLLVKEINPVPSSLKTAQYLYYVKIYHDNGQLLMETKNMDKIIPDLQYPKLDALNWREDYLSWHSMNGRDYLSMTAPIESSEKNKSDFYMNMVFDGSYPESMVRQYRNKAILSLAVAVLIVIALSHFIARKGLSRLYEMVSITESISANRLTERIETNACPKELVPLGRSYNKMLERIENAFQRLSDCSSELAHELRTPINNLMLTTEITLSNCRKPSEYKVVLESNYEEYRRLARIIDNVLFLAKAENPAYSITKVTVNVQRELKKIVEYYKIMASEKFIRICLEGNGSIKTELILFQRLIGNLLTNAIKYTPSRGKITVSIKNDLENYLILSVTDTGGGISKDQLSNIFDRFYRIKSSESYNISGSGLGLTIVKSIMKLHHGDVKIKSEVGKGTQISLWFPLANVS